MLTKNKMDRSLSRQDQAKDFINDSFLESLVKNQKFDRVRFDEIIAKSIAKVPLTPDETAQLISAEDPEQLQTIFSTARQLKRDVYGNRIVLFAPLYIGNKCVNNCGYCAFKSSNTEMERKTLTRDEIIQQVQALEKIGHKRVILVFGEHPKYDADYIADVVRTVYAVQNGPDQIRRVNINAAPFDHKGFTTIKQAGIGTFQVFQESYHHATYQRCHPANTLKGDYLWRLDSLSRAFEAGCDDMGIGALFGLYDWRFEVLALVTHTRHLMETYGVGAHTLSFPRLRPASQVDATSPYTVSDDDFKRLVAILRLSVPYAGMILTAREPAHIRNELLGFGVSQIDAGSRIDLGGYQDDNAGAMGQAKQFDLGDFRSLDEVMLELLSEGYIPSFCTSCYRNGRTGKQFMEFAIPGFIEGFCTPNALLTLTEYLLDYGSPKTQENGFKLIDAELVKMKEQPMKQQLLEKLAQIKASKQRDLNF